MSVAAQTEYIAKQFEESINRCREMEERMRDVLNRACSEKARPCKACGVHLWLVSDPKTGNVTPFTYDGQNHAHYCRGVRG